MTRSREPRELAEAVRAACLAAALDAYEDAGLRGLCGEGRLEVALDAVRALDLAPILDPPGSTAHDAARSSADDATAT